MECWEDRQPVVAVEQSYQIMGGHQGAGHCGQEYPSIEFSPQGHLQEGDTPKTLKKGTKDFASGFLSRLSCPLP